MAVDRRRLLAAVLATMVVAGGCSNDDEPADDRAGGDRGEMSTPTFVDEGEGDPVPTSAADGELVAPTTTGGTGPSEPAPSTAPEGPGAVTTAAGGAPKESVAFDDPVGDATPGIGTTPPPWTDLAGASLERRNNAYRLSIRLGGPAPQSAPGAETMNIATYFDIDRDGDVEYELWVNLGPHGWGPVWYDDKGNAAPGDRSNVTVVVEGDRVRLLFPDVMIDKPNRLRFSVASEYGPLSSIGSSTARRDDAPDDDQAVAFP